MELLSDYTLRVVALGAAILGAVSGALGSFAVLRRQSLLGDALSHAALPGIALAYLLTSSKTPLVIMVGAAASGLAATAAIRLIQRRSRVPSDSALGLALAVFFGLGLVLLTYLQKRPDAAQAGLDSFLFGQAAALLRRDVVAMAVLGLVSLGLVFAFWKQLKLLAFDPDFAASLGLPVARLDALLTGLLVVAIVIGLQTVGVVLMSAMVVAPAAAARQWTHRLGPMVVLASAVGLGSGVAGAVASSAVPRLPTGPTIVLFLTVAVGMSLVFAPGRGLLWRRMRLGRLAGGPRESPVLMHLYALSLQHPDDPDHGHSVKVLETMSPAGVSILETLTALEVRGLAQHNPDDTWAPTPLGRREARRNLEQEEHR